MPNNGRKVEQQEHFTVLTGKTGPPAFGKQFGITY